MIDRIVRYAEEHKEIVSVSREQLLAVMSEPNLTQEEQGSRVHSASATCVWGAYPKELWSCGDGQNRRLSIFLRLLHDSELAYEVFDKFGRPQGRSTFNTSSMPSLEKLQVSFSSLPFTFFAQLLAGLRK
eukprot:gene69603-biopygen44239